MIAAARRIATDEGWAAVTIRRLAQEIEYSQPVLYSHFENREAIVMAVALLGFRELTSAIRQAAHETRSHRIAPERAALAYLAFARDQPALYEAMFTLSAGLRFAKPETRSELREAFAALAAVVGSSKCDVELATETFWAALHGVAELERSNRIRHTARTERVKLIIGAVLDC